MQKITPFLWFSAPADEAAHYYASIFPDAKVGRVSKFPMGEDETAGFVVLTEIELFGQTLQFMSGGATEKFNETFSFMVKCETQEEVDVYWDKLLEGGSSMACGWLRDRYGLCWQITPRFLMDAQETGTPEQVGRMMAAMMQMVKLDIAALKAAYDGE